MYRDPSGQCQLGTAGADSNIVKGAEIAGCQLSCGSILSQACAVEDGQGGCTVACNCDPLHKSCDDIERGRNGTGGIVDGPATTQSSGL